MSVKGGSQQSIAERLGNHSTTVVYFLFGESFVATKRTACVFLPITFTKACLFLTVRNSFSSEF